MLYIQLNHYNLIYFLEIPFKEDRKKKYSLLAGEYQHLLLQKRVAFRNVNDLNVTNLNNNIKGFPGRYYQGSLFQTLCSEH